MAGVEWKFWRETAPKYGFWLHRIVADKKDGGRITKYANKMGLTPFEIFQPHIAGAVASITEGEPGVES